MARTVGVEEEFLLLARSSSELLPLGEPVARSAARRSDGQFEHELKQEQAELGTDPCRSGAELAAQVRQRRSELASAADRNGARLAALATAPHPQVPTGTADERYERMGRQFGQVATAQLTCGMHVHVSVDSRAEGVAVVDRLGPWLSVVRALSTNSPFWGGVDTGYASYRTVLWGLWPTAGPTEVFGDVTAYERVCAELVASGAAMDDGMLYFDARPSARYPTVEVRVADVCPDAADAVTLALLIRALVDLAAADWAAGIPPLVLRSELLRAATWRAARWGVTESLFDLATLEPVPAWDLVDALVERVRASLVDTGDEDTVQAGLAAIRARGTGAELQRRAYAEAGSLDAVVDAVAARTVAG